MVHCVEGIAIGLSRSFIYPSEVDYEAVRSSANAALYLIYPQTMPIQGGQ